MPEQATTQNGSPYMLKQTIIIFLAALGSASPTVAQDANRAAVDTLTKDVALAVFANIQRQQDQLKAVEIYGRLLNCGDGCDPLVVIREVGSWDQVGAKMEELGKLKLTASFLAMSPAGANAAIRRELARFYTRYKADKNYGVPLNAGVQAQILAKIDALLPPAIAAVPNPAVTDKATNAPTADVDGPSGNDGIDPNAIQISQLKRAVKEEQENKLWMIILSAIAGLLVGAAGVYFALYRVLKQETNRLRDDNAKLSRELDGARRTKATNESRQPQPENRKRPDAQPPQPRPAAEPLTPPAGIGTGLAVPGAPVSNEAGTAAAAAATVVPAPAPVAAAVPPPARSEVFYFPPPDPNGQFDSAQRSDMLSPESAYRFSTTAGALATQPVDAALFRFEAEPGRVARFLTYRNYMIEPACDSENSYSTQYTRIVNRRDGEAVLENGVWRVKTKALIRYE